jgi:type II secretion system protein J
MAMRYKKSRERGFTLVEALVSLFVFGLISAGCVLLLVQSTQGQQRLDAAQSQARDLQALQAILSRDMALRVTSHGLQSGRASDLVILQDDTGVRVQIARVSAAADEGPERTVFVEYHVTDATLVRRVSPVPFSNAQAVADAQILVRKVDGITVQFHDGIAWRPSWPASSGAAPLAVGFQIRVRDTHAILVASVLGRA